MLSRDPIADREEKARACEDVLKSRTFARSEQLVQFLRYICDLELDGRGSEITEYSIATGALNRSADYSPVEDSSVRSRAHALRRKLQEYYQSERPDAEVRIDLPKGSYRPVFLTQNETSSRAPESTPVLETRPAVLRKAIPWTIVLSVAAVVLAGGILLWFHPWDAIDPLVRAAWGPVLQRGGDVLVLISAPPLIRPVPSQPGVKPEASTLETAPDWATQWYEGLNLDNRGGPVYLAPTRGYSVFSDAVAAMTVSSLLGTAGSSYLVMPEYAIQPRAIHENGLVVIGAPMYSSYLARILKTTPYSMWFDPVLHEEVLGLKSARSSPVYTAKRNPKTHRYSTVYGLITVLPSQPGHPRPERTLIFAGFTGSPGAQAAIEYFRSPAALRDLQRRLRQQGYSAFPPAFQVVVRCGVDRETAISAIYETHVVISSIPLIE